ncbi:hypothetical protein SAMN05192588_2733 [Nonlabens sp. Hel1_33_55]|uniref:hypothetical protein n=1 Tax=Nonlabens sp. Hel1_33_55 TaxID=1336802 RepID=UPI000875D319|nr:hypothetical protein [Nonlabens sp. Hel1_33_55]SCY41028.1 hypothetical protein SAMN05192588_2733 [Nonlabens sp. Hel1_33_55]
MKKIEITLSDEQYATIKNEIEQCSMINVEEAVMTGFSFTVSNGFAGFSWMEFEMHKKIDLGDVSWKFVG